MKRRHKQLHARFWLLAAPLFIAVMVYASLNSRLPPISSDSLHDSVHHHGGDLQ